MSTGGVKWWGASEIGCLGYPGPHYDWDIGDNETPASKGDVDIGGPAIQVTAGEAHTCALLRTGKVRCWGSYSNGRLGYDIHQNIGDDETPASAGNVDVGTGTVVQLTAGDTHTCALLDTGAMRCWGTGSEGELGYANIDAIGDDETAGSGGDVDVGGAVVQAVAGDYHTCALLDTGVLRCWGWGAEGQLGYGNTNDIGDDETPDSAGDVPAF